MEPLQKTLFASLCQVADFRKARGQRFAWDYLLALVAAAVAAGQTSVAAMVAWAQAHADELFATLRPKRPRIPSLATWRRLLALIDITALEQVVAAYNQALDAADATSGQVTMNDGQVFRGQAIDGKEVRGASAHGTPTFLVSLVRHDSAYVLAQQAVAVKTNEITVVPTLLAGRDLTATVTTMDALLTQRSLAQQILAQHGHYLMIIKKNQPTLYEAAELVFREPPVPARPGELLSTQTANKAHGRLEIRSLASTTALNAYLSWPGVAQIMRRTCYRRNMRTGQGPNHAPHLLPPQHAYRPSRGRGNLWPDQLTAPPGRPKATRTNLAGPLDDRESLALCPR
jgi:predicted transposase YbfD/YdcC